MSLFGISIYLIISHVLLQQDTKTTVEYIVLNISNANSSDHGHTVHYLRKSKLLY